MLRIRVAGCIKMQGARAGGIAWRTLVHLLACTLGRTKEMALVDYQSTIGRETNEAICIIPALNVQHAYRIILNTEFSWLDAKIYSKIFFRLARDLKARRRTWERAERRRPSVQRQPCAEQRTRLGGVQGADRRCSESRSSSHTPRHSAGACSNSAAPEALQRKPEHASSAANRAVRLITSRVELSTDPSPPAGD